MKGKPVYAPIPARAMGDERLSAVDLRVLMAIAAHDRLGANGAGCYASHSRLAALVGCHLKSLSRSMASLAKAGYLTGRANPLNARTRIYNVVYSDFDAAYLKAGGVGIGSETVTCPTHEDRPIGNGTATQNGSIGNKSGEISEQIHGDDAINIFCEAVIHSPEGVEIDPAEAAREPPQPRKRGNEMKPAESVGAILAMCERGMKANPKTFDPSYWHAYLANLLSGMAKQHPPNAEQARATRLLHEVSAIAKARAVAA